jgi:dTDP-glucose 4,6-dehydratase
MADLLVTGGAGFIGANFVRYWRQLHPDDGIVVLDALTYAGNRENLAGVADMHFVHGDIRDEDLVRGLLQDRQIDTLVNFAAETHVDRSIDGPEAFLDTNVLGTHALLKAARAAWLDAGSGRPHRFHHISTDEVYGTLGPADPAFSETTPFAPNSPYAASKAASDHLVRAYHHTYGLQVTTSNCSNNYGPYQFPEKLIPLVIHNALGGKPLPIYGDGKQVRDWLHVEDHCRATLRVLEAGVTGQVYNIGGLNEMTNIDVVSTLCEILDGAAPRSDGRSYKEQITFVTDRPGHDRRYAIDCRKIESELGWKPEETFQSGIRKTVQWYVDNRAWVDSVTSGAYRAWVDRQYAF